MYCKHCGKYGRHYCSELNRMVDADEVDTFNPLPVMAAIIASESANVSPPDTPDPTPDSSGTSAGIPAPDVSGGGGDFSGGGSSGSF